MEGVRQEWFKLEQNGIGDADVGDAYGGYQFCSMLGGYNTAGNCL